MAFPKNASGFEMKPIELTEIRNLVEYEKVREAMRAEVIELKNRRRVSVGGNLTFLFENRETVLFQIQEMIRTERIVEDARIQDEIDAYNALVPPKGELSATLFIEIPDLHLMSQDQVRKAVNRFQGLDRGCVRLVVGSEAIPARFEGGHSKEEKMAAVQYLRFEVPASAARLLAGSTSPVRLVVGHPAYSAETTLSPGTRMELAGDLAAP
jgi:Protein of unknown function (DUF3501)